MYNNNEYFNFDEYYKNAKVKKSVENNNKNKKKKKSTDYGLNKFSIAGANISKAAHKIGKSANDVMYRYRILVSRNIIPESKPLTDKAIELISKLFDENGPLMKLNDIIANKSELIDEVKESYKHKDVVEVDSNKGSKFEIDKDTVEEVQAHENITKTVNEMMAETKKIFNNATSSVAQEAILSNLNKSLIQMNANQVAFMKDIVAKANKTENSIAKIAELFELFVERSSESIKLITERFEYAGKSIYAMAQVLNTIGKKINTENIENNIQTVANKLEYLSDDAYDISQALEKLDKKISTTASKRRGLFSK